MRIITYDIEVARPIEDTPEGWSAARKGACGISTIVLYDSTTERYHLYDEHRFEDCLNHLNAADLLVSFNGIDFDTPVLESVTGFPVVPPQFDLLRAVWDALGHRERGYKLGLICERTLGKTKNGSGVGAPTLVSEGRWGELFDYNLNDVYLTRTLYNHIKDKGSIIAVDGTLLEIRLPLGDEHA